jgi:hypothetical protein
VQLDWLNFRDREREWSLDVWDRSRLMREINFLNCRQHIKMHLVALALHRRLSPEDG